MENTINEKILEDIREMLSKLYITFRSDTYKDGSFLFDFEFPGIGLPARFAVRISEAAKHIRMSVEIKKVIPEKKRAVVTELANLINCGFCIDHVYIQPEFHTAVVKKGVILEKGRLNKKELEVAFHNLLWRWCLYFPLILKQISSNETPQEIMKTFLEEYKDILLIRPYGGD